MRFFKPLLSFLLLIIYSLVPAHASRPQVQFPPETWAQFRGNHQLIGVSVSGVPRELRVLWTYEAGDSIESSAAISNGVVYVGCQTGDLAALSLSDGSVRWKYRATGPIGESSPCVSNGVVYIGDLNGTVHAVRASDGRSIWTFKTNGEVKSSPVVVGDRVLIGSYDEHLYCIAVSNGSLIWKFRTQGPVHCTAGVSNGVAHIAGCDETFRAIRISDGRELFHVASGAYTGASPALVAQTAYYGTFNNDVLAVSLTTRRIRWRY
ncbi:MAG TPA: PQQ-binding-like beta-propeller repeat protein, partial [Blastocatellia bacterium]